MNWISFAERRPEEEPERLVLVHFKSGAYHAVYSKRLTSPEITHWAEIEPPPKPDPFEEAWKAAEQFRNAPVYGLCRYFWDAGFRHALTPPTQERIKAMPISQEGQK